MPQTTALVGPADHGRRMSLDEFNHAVGRAGYRYELGRGVVVVTDIPGTCHLLVLCSLRQQLDGYKTRPPGRIAIIAGAAECKILIADLESERHPDLAVYMAPPPDDEDVWSTWVPELVAEIVSPGSEERDYVEKREEYLRFGVSEYWIVDAAKEQILVLRRSRGQWVERVLKPGDRYQPRLLPGFELAAGEILQA